MKTLILCVDRDDDIGQKTGLHTPLVGRKHNVEAATALGLADPEDSDTNAIFSAIHLFDQERLANQNSQDQVEVATICGHRRVGIRSDRRLADQLDEVLELTRADEVILVSDGAQDEQILPILTSRVKVAHVHRSVVRQAPRLEGFYHILTRMLDDKQIAQRYLLPLAIIMMIWGVAFLAGAWIWASGLTLLLAGIWLVVQALRWEGPIMGFLHDFVDGLRSGTITLLANLVMLLLLLLGLFEGWQSVQAGEGAVLDALRFTEGFFLYAVSGWLVRIAGKILHEYVRSGEPSIRNWTAAFTLISMGFIGGVALDLALAATGGLAFDQLLRLDLVVRLLVGLLVAASGIIVGSYIRNFFQDTELQETQG